MVACANLHSLATASRDPAFFAALQAASHVTADGAPVRAAGRLLREPAGPRVTGYDVFQHVMASLESRGGRALFVGSRPPVLERIRANAARDYPRVHVDVLSPPFGDLAGEPTKLITARVDEFRPDVVFVGMSAPKQEIWAASNAHMVNAMSIVCIGAVFDYYAGTLRRAPAWARRIGCEWCFRLAQEPRRVWRKYLISGPLFARLVWAELRVRRTQRSDG
jgi:N-acetylglucosaminyldiphosphoundecaprenol N-acetyl-beta-D-mannosaminyltransferase